VAGECPRGLVVPQHRHPELADAGGPRPLGERREQRRAHPAALPFVHHLERHLGDVELIQPHVARDPDRSPRQGRVGDEGLAVPVVDVEQATELARGQLGLGGEVALVAGLRAQPSEGKRHRAVVGGHEFADRDRRHLIPRT
jgi:hypothetical protein